MFLTILEMHIRLVRRRGFLNEFPGALIVTLGLEESYLNTPIVYGLVQGRPRPIFSLAYRRFNLSARTKYSSALREPMSNRATGRCRNA